VEEGDMLINVGRLVTTLFFLMVFFLPVDSFPLWPISNQYRPISILFCVCLFLYFLSSNKLSKNGVVYLCILMAMILYSLTLNYIWFNAFFASVIVKLVIVLMLSFVIYESLYRASHLISNSVGIGGYLDLIRKALFLAHSILFLLFIFQFLARFNLISDSVSESLTSLTTYRTVENRIQLASGEASMMFRTFLLATIFVFCFDENKLRRNLFIIYFILTVVTSNSTYSIVVLIFYIAMYYLISLQVSMRQVLGFVGALFALPLVIYSYMDISGGYAQGKISLIISLLSSPSDFFAILANSGDGSAFQRLVNPVIGFLILIKTNGLGSGGEAYHLFYPSIIYEYFPYAAEFDSVKSVISGGSYITPKSLISKLGSDFGVFGLGFYIYLLSYLFFTIRKSNKFIPKKTYSFLNMLLAYIIICSLNQDSYMYINIIFSVVIILTVLKAFRKNSSDKYPLIKSL
jgi:hypothetical protein